MPCFLPSRMLLLLLLAILFLPDILTGIWMQQIQWELEGMLSTTRNLALSAASTVNFFKSLPLQYRHIAPGSAAQHGGSRFFVSLNEEEIHISAIPDERAQDAGAEGGAGGAGPASSPTPVAIKVDSPCPEELHCLQQRHPCWRTSLLLGPLHSCH